MPTGFAHKIKGAALLSAPWQAGLFRRLGWRGQVARTIMDPAQEHRRLLGKVEQFGRHVVREVVTELGQSLGDLRQLRR